MRNNNIAAMQLFPRADSTSQSFSRTSCVYESETEQSSIKKYNLHRSRIDQLYGKYISLFDRKLSNSSVSTRVVNDRLARRVSDSTLRLVKNPDLRTRKHQHVDKTPGNAESRGIIREIFDYIDKELLPNQRKRSKCSCCSCSLKVRISESDRKQHNNKRPFTRGLDVEYSGNIQLTMKERHSKRRLQFKAKHRRSDSCSCIYKFSGLNKKESKTLIQKIHPVLMEQFRTKAEQPIIKESKFQNFRSYENYQSVQEKIEENLLQQCFNKSSQKARKSFVLHTKRLLQGMKTAKHKLKANIESDHNTFEDLEFLQGKTKFQQKKESIVKFKEYLIRKEMMKDWECDFGCLLDTHVSEQCFNIIKLQCLPKRIEQQDRKLQGIEIDKIPLVESSFNVQEELFSKTTSAHMKKPKVTERQELNNNFQEKNIEDTFEPCAPSPVPEKKHVRNIEETRYVRRTYLISKDKPSQPLKIDESDTSSCQPVSIPPSSSFEMESCKMKPVSKICNKSIENSCTGNESRCKEQEIHLRHKDPQAITKPSCDASEWTLNEPNEKSNKHDIKMRITRLLKSICSLKTNTICKSVSSSTRKPATVDRSVSNESMTKETLSQVSNPNLALNVNPSYKKSMARFGSTFSFNLEFYKTNDQNKNNNNVLPKSKRSCIKSTCIRTRNTLNKCFSKLSKLGIIKKSKTSTTGSKNCFACKTKLFLPPTFDKSIETRRRNQLKLPLPCRISSYECEPGLPITCDCHPLVPNKILKTRNSKQPQCQPKCVKTAPCSRKAKSTSSICSRLKSPKAKVVQSSVITTKAAKTTTCRKNKRNHKSGQNVLNSNECGPRDVRLGSNFRLNIEFYKNKQTSSNGCQSRVSSTPKAVQYKGKKCQRNQQQQQNKNMKPICTQVMDWNKNIKTYLGRCFSAFKLYKNKYDKLTKLRRGKIFTADRKTVHDVIPVAETTSKDTETKRQANSKSLTFERDSNICLENLKRRIPNTKECEMFTPNPKTRSKLSCKENCYKTCTSVLAGPKLNCKGTNMKRKYTKLVDANPRFVAQRNAFGNSFTCENCKQIVRIPLSFDFGIESCKQLPQTVMLTKHPKSIQTRKYTDESIKATGVFRDIDIQSQVVKKVHRQKKTKRLDPRGPWPSMNKIPTVCTLSTAFTNNTELISPKNMVENIKPKAREKMKMISISASSFLLKNCNREVAKYDSLKLDHAFKIPLCLPQPAKLNSNSSIEVECKNKYYPLRIFSVKHPIKSLSYVCTGENLQDRVNAFSQISEPNPEKPNYTDQYLDRCYCIMNVQISREKQNKKTRINHRSKPYECESSFCIPDEGELCKCQKLMIKRLMRNKHKVSATKTTNKSISTYITNSKSGSKSTQYKTHVKNGSQELKPNKSEQQKLSRGNKKNQAVCIGSNFRLIFPSVKTRFLKGCFCTSKLHGIKVPQHSDTSKFSSQSLKKGINKIHRKVPNNVLALNSDKQTIKPYRQKMYGQRLEANECKPGTYQCHPYLYNNIRNQRIFKQYSNESSTEPVHTHSVSCTFGYNKRLKNMKEIKTDPGKIIPCNKRGKINHMKNIGPSSVPLVCNNITNMKDKKMKTLGLNPIKRWFCTLKLLNRRVNTDKIDNKQYTKRIVTNRAVRTQLHRQRPAKSNCSSFDKFLKNYAYAKKCNKDGKLNNKPPISAISYKIKATSTYYRRVKRFFCTLKFQKHTPQKVPRKNVARSNVNILVERVAIEPLNKNIVKTQRLANTVKKCTCTDPKCLIDSKFLATQTDTKYVPKKKFMPSQCNHNICSDHSKNNSLSKRIKENMDTTREIKNKIEKIRHHNDKPFERLIFDKGKRLTVKKSKKPLPTKHLGKCSNPSFSCRCARLFFQQNKNVPIALRKQDAKNNDHPFDVKRVYIKSKDINLTKNIRDDKCPIIRSKYTNKSRIRIGQGRHSKSEERRKSDFKNQNTLRPCFADSTKSPNYSISTKQLHHRSNIRTKYCYSCSVNDCPLQTNDEKFGLTKCSVLNSCPNCLIKNNTPVSYLECPENCQYCECCKTKIDVDEISKGAGDRQSVVSSKCKGDITALHCDKDYVHDKIKVASNHEKLKADTFSQKYPSKKKYCTKSLLKAQVDSVNYKYVNKNQVTQSVDKLKIDIGNEHDRQCSTIKTRHGNSCICCKCNEIRQQIGAKLSNPAKGVPDIPDLLGAPLSFKQAIYEKPPTKRSVWGSNEFPKPAKRDATKSQVILKVKHGKRCVWRSPVCKNQSKKIKEIQELVGQREETVAKRILMRKKRKILGKQLKINHSKDEIHRSKRMKCNEELDRPVNDCKNDTTLTLMADSMTNVLNLRMTRNIGAAATDARVRTRISFMKRIHAMKNKLEQYPITHCLLHAADRNAKTRLFKQKPVKRVRGSLDFKHTRNVAALRNRSHLCVHYNRSPFYSHFLTMRNTCKRFMDIMLFLLAAVAGTPFILCMAVGYKAIKCCCFRLSR